MLRRLVVIRKMCSKWHTKFRYLVNKFWKIQVEHLCYFPKCESKNFHSFKKFSLGTSMYYVTKIWGFLTPPLPPLWLLLVLNVIKNCHFLTPLPSLWLRNTWMFPKTKHSFMKIYSWFEFGVKCSEKMSFYLGPSNWLIDGWLKLFCILSSL
mgnify:CR=1 FL=1